MSPSWGWCLSLLSLFAWAQDPVVHLHYHTRIPFMSQQQGLVMGLVADPVREAVLKAGLNVIWQETPSKRQMEVIAAGHGLDCGIGWFRTVERERIAQFSLPLYQDQPMVVLTRADTSTLHDGMTVLALLRSDLRLLRRDGYSYGAELDEAINQYQPPGYLVTVSNLAMLRMIQLGRADYLFITPEELDNLLPQQPSRAGLRVLSLQDMPRGSARYLMCSRAVPLEWLARFNAALQQ